MKTTLYDILVKNQKRISDVVGNESAFAWNREVQEAITLMDRRGLHTAEDLEKALSRAEGGQ